jgi:hypothetical protein
VLQANWTLSCAPLGIQAAFDQDWASGRITHHSYRNGSEDGALAYKLLIQTGNAQEPLDFSQVGRGVQHGQGVQKAYTSWPGLTLCLCSWPQGSW